MTMRASPRASELVPPRRFSMARANVFTVIISLHPAPRVIWASVTFIGLPERDQSPPAAPSRSMGWRPRGPTFILSRLNIAEHPLSRPAGLCLSSGSNATEVRENGCRSGQGAPCRPLQRRIRLRELPRKGRARTSSPGEERRDLERHHLAGRPCTNQDRVDVSFSWTTTQAVAMGFTRTEWTEWDLNPRLPPCEGGDLPLIYRPSAPCTSARGI